MAGKKIGLVLALDGEREFTQAARNAQKEANMFKAELKKLTAEFDGNANSIDFLRKKQENLAKQQDAYSKKVEAAHSGLEKANTNYSRQCKRLSELETELTKAKSAFEELKRTQDQSSTEYRKQEKEVEKLTTAVEKQKLARDRESGSITDWKKQITDAETAQAKINIEIKKNARLMKEAESATNGLAKSIDGYGNEVQQTVKITETLGQSIKEGFGEAIGGKGFELLEKGAEVVADTMVDASGASKQLAASTGLSEDAAKRYQKVMQGIKGDNFGESYKDIANVMGEVVQIMGQLDDSAMKETTESAIALRDTFDMDINETIRAVDVMMKTMGVDAAKAFDLITVGAQNGLNRSGELVDNLTEYSQLWGQAGFSAEEMFAILENGLDAGAYNLDKVNDYVKEFGNSLADGRVAKNIGSFSEGTKMLFESWKQGGASTSDVFYSVINDLSEMENQQKALTIASEVWSALGEDNAMQVLTALDDVNDKYKEVAGAAEKLKEIKYSDLESAIGGLGSALQEKFVTPIANIAIPAVTELAEMATDLIKGPEKASNEWQEMADGLSQANSELAATVQNRDSIVADAEAEAAKLDHLGERLLALNEITGKTNGEKAEMRQVVNQLGQSIPELAAAYDEETGKINLTETAIRNYIAAEKESITTQATLAANQELINSLIAAQSEYDKTAEKMETLQDSATIYESQISALEKLEQEYTDGTISQKEYEDGLMQIAMSYEDMLASGEVSLSTLGRFLHENLQKTETELKGVTEEHNNLGETIKEGTEKINADNESAKKLTESLGEMGETAGEAGDSLETVGDAAEDVAEKISASAETQKAALQSVRDAYQETRASIEEDLKSKISITEMFDGGEDLTTEKMNEILDSNLEGIKNYQENLAKVREMTDENGKALFSPEVIDEIEKGGTEYANILNHMVYTWEEQGEYGYEQIKSIAEKWGEGLDFSEQTAEAEAANQVALDAMLGKLGSSDADFSNLTKTIEEEWADLPVATVSALQETVSAAKEMGVQIPEGLAEGIASGEISPEDAISQLNGSMQGMFDGLVEVAGLQGSDIVNELSSGIQSGGQAAVDAYNALIALLLERSEQAEYQEAGDSAMQQYAQGIESGKGQATSKAGSMASAVLEKIRARQFEGSAIGFNISAGVAAGISGGAALAIVAATGMATAALAAAKAALGIHSPSRRFRYEVGQNISESTAFGIKDKASLAGRAASKMSAKVYTRATSWMSRYKKAHKVTLEDEKYFWQQIQKHTKSGTSAYKRAQKQIDRIVTQQIGSSELATQIGKNFGVSRTTKSGRKKKKKDSETYYSEIYSAAEKYMKNYQVLHAVSEQQELAYWTQVRSKLKSKTQAWYDATAKIKSLQQEIVESEARATEEKANVQDALLDKYKVYYKVSAKAEMEYWNIARKQFKAGTDERIEADKKYLDAMQEFYDQRKELDEEYKENSQDINDQLIEDIKDLQDAYKDAVQSRKDDILSQMDLFEAWDSEGYDADTLLYNLKTQVAGLTLWEQQLEELGKKGVSSALLDELKAMGPDAAASIYSLNQMTAEQLSEYQKLWEQKNALAESQAVKDNEGLRHDTNKEIADLRTEAQAELNALNAEYRSALNELNTGLSSDLEKLVNKASSIGEEAVSKMIASIGKAANSVDTYKSTTKVVNSVSSQLSTLEPAGATIGKSTLDGLLEALTNEQKISIAAKKTIQSIKQAMQEEAEINSPAKLFDREVGKYIPDGVAGGMDRAVGKTEESAQKMVRKAFRSAREELQKQRESINSSIPNLDYSGIKKLNRLMEIPQQGNIAVNIDNRDTVSTMRQLLEEMRAVREDVANMQVILYPDTIAGGIQTYLSKENAASSIRMRRGR